MSLDSFNSRDTLTVDDTTYTIYRLDRMEGAACLPYSLKVMLENLLRIDTPAEAGYYRHGGILPYMLRELLDDTQAAAELP